MGEGLKVVGVVSVSGGGGNIRYSVEGDEAIKMVILFASKYFCK